MTPDELDKAREGYLQAMKVGRSSDAALKHHIDPKKLVVVGAGDCGEEKKPAPVQ